MTHPPRPLLRPPEAAEWLAISPRKLWSLTASGAIPAVKIGRSVRYSLADLENWITEQKTGGQPA